MNKIIRALVIALSLTGTISSLDTAKAVAQTVKPKASFLPVPMCPPNDPDACGIDK